MHAFLFFCKKNFSPPKIGKTDKSAFLFLSLIHILLYGRRKIEDQVRDLEKKGTKLYGLAPIPFLLWLMGAQEAQAAQLPNGQILQNVLASAGQSGAAGAGTASAAGTGAASQGGAAAAVGTKAAAGGLGAVKLGLIAVAAVAVIGARVYGVSRDVDKRQAVPPR